MKGNIKIVVESTDEFGSFPVTEKITLERNNTYESLEEWVYVFKKILYCAGFSEELVSGVFNEEM